MLTEDMKFLALTITAVVALPLSVADSTGSDVSTANLRASSLSCDVNSDCPTKYCNDYNMCDTCLVSSECDNGYFCNNGSCAYAADVKVASLTGSSEHQATTDNTTFVGAVVGSIAAVAAAVGALFAYRTRKTESSAPLLA